MSEFKIIKVDRFDSKAIRHALDDVAKQVFNNRVNIFILIATGHLSCAINRVAHRRTKI